LGKSISPRVALPMMLVKMLSATTLMISTISPSGMPAGGPIGSRVLAATERMMIPAEVEINSHKHILLLRKME